MYTVKYAGCDLIPYIPVQIRAVSVQDYPGNSCNAASPQLISLWMSGESWVIHQRELPKLQCIIPSQFFISSTCLVCKRHDLGFSVLTACRVFIMGIRLQWLRCGAIFPLSSKLQNANGIFVIIRQSLCSQSSNHHCRLASFLKLRCYNEEVAMDKMETSKCSQWKRDLNRITPKLSWLAWRQKHIVKLTSIEPDVCGEEATGEAEIPCNYHSLWKLRLTFLSRELLIEFRGGITHSHIHSQNVPSAILQLI